MFFIVTAGSDIPKTQAPSQGAGQTLPVNSKYTYDIYYVLIQNFSNLKKYTLLTASLIFTIQITFLIVQTWEIISL